MLFLRGLQEKKKKGMKKAQRVVLCSFFRDMPVIQIELIVLLNSESYNSLFKLFLSLCIYLS